MLSRRSRAYKEHLDGREADLSDDELLDLMVVAPTLLRRPLVVSGERAVVGFDRPALDALIAET